jgi:cobalt-precorrin 5A hydrolase
VAEPVVVYLTPRGQALAQRLVEALGGELVSAHDNARQVLQEQFQVQAGRPLVCLMALGIVVRILGPLARDKASDAPVVVVDDMGRFAISVFGGHEGGANALASKVARALGAIPVITTASDALGLPAVDLIGRDCGWLIERRENLTTVAAAVVRGERIGVYQDAGRRAWWQPFGPWPETFQTLTTWPPAGSFAGLLVISDRLLARTESCPTVVYRPPTLVLGVGCRRGTSAREIEELFRQVFQEHGFAPASLGLVATVSLKADEPGLQEFAAGHRVPLVSYASGELADVGPLPTPSAKVQEKIGLAGVAEPAALRAAGATELLVAKVRGRRTTMALARREA